jgi:hypothetical protein
MNNKKSKIITNTISLIAAVMLIFMLFFKIGIVQRIYWYNGMEFPYDTVGCSGFTTLLFNYYSEYVMDKWFIFVGILNWLFLLCGLILTALNIISFAICSPENSRLFGKITVIIATIVSLIYLIEGVGAAFAWGGDRCTTYAYIPFIFEVIFLIAFFVCSKKIPIIETEEEKQNRIKNELGEGNGYVDLTKHVLFILFVPFWTYVWIYRVTGYLNRIQDMEKRDPTKKLLLCLFVPFYTIYWMYQSGLRIDKIAQEHGVNSDLATLCLVLSIFIGIVPPIIMQQKINEIELAENGNKAGIGEIGQVNSVQHKKDEQSFSVADEIKKYKELLDMGAITQEEFENIKAKLLDM